jgi:hypothetical protein
MSHNSTVERVDLVTESNISPNLAAALLGRQHSRRWLLQRTLVAAASSLAVTSRVGLAQEIATPGPASPVPSEMFDALGQLGLTAEGWPIQMLLASPEILVTLQRDGEFAELNEMQPLIVIASREHGGALDPATDDFVIHLRIDAQPVDTPPERRLLSDTPLQREEAFIFTDVPAGVTAENHLIEVQLPSTEGVDPITFMWITPLPVLAGSATPAAAGTPSSESGDGSMTDIMETVIPDEEIEVC